MRGPKGNQGAYFISEGPGARSIVEGLMELDSWDYLTFLSFLMLAGGAVGVVVFMLGLPGRIAYTHKHPEADPVNRMGWLRYLVVCAWLLAAIAGTTGCNQKHPDLAETPAPVVEVAQPVERQVIDYQVFTARTEAVQSVDVKARVTGYLTKLGFKD